MDVPLYIEVPVWQAICSTGTIFPFLKEDEQLYNAVMEIFSFLGINPLLYSFGFFDMIFSRLILISFPARQFPIRLDDEDYSAETLKDYIYCKTNKLDVQAELVFTDYIKSLDRFKSNPCVFNIFPTRIIAFVLPKKSPYTSD